MSPDLERIVHDYLARLRASMRPAPGDLAAEAEREIRAHIEDALAAEAEPSVGQLLDALERLGPPEEYGRDLGLYMMVDRGYRQWSLPDMVLSTAYWAASTVAGAVIVAIFGALYIMSAALVCLGLARMIVGPIPWPPATAVAAVPPVGLVVVGMLTGVGLLVLTHWFVGQYVHSARPRVLGGVDGDAGWRERTGRRIVALALGALVVSLAAGWGSGAYRLEPTGWPHLPPDFGGSPLGWLAGAALVVVLLAPVIGLAWSALETRRAR